MSENEKILAAQDEYKYGFHNEDESVYNSGKGLNEEVIRAISRVKNEPDWMLEFRLQSYRIFEKMPMQDWGVDLSDMDFNDYTYYIKPVNEDVQKNWENVPESIRDTFNKLGIPEAEQKFLAGVSTQYESEVVYHNMLKEVEEKGIIFLDTDTAVKTCPEILRKYFGKIIPNTDNKFAALNGAVWSGGSFIYVPPGVHLDKPLQSYFRINSERMTQNERTLIIVDDGSDITYVEGCTAPQYSLDSLHTGVVEIYVGKNAHCRYTTIQNWSNNIRNLVTQRAKVMENGFMEWVDGNVGSMMTMKYPACVLAEEGAKGAVITIAVASRTQIQDSGAKMIHLAPRTSGTIISKSVARLGGEADFRSWVYHSPKAVGAKTHIECDTLILDDLSKSDTIPMNRTSCSESTITHEATVSKVSEEQLFYLMSRGLSEEEATQMIVMGFLSPFTKELPMEYAVELNQLMKLDMSGSVG
ncbi:MAG: Fe-S cluster assembly protein SufB [Erysipelotrichales bacterium]|nr:Fe-S cluster assembly protein SufB [Erysipelotrichales bacterium]